jgi:hypothetical protein
MDATYTVKTSVLTGDTGRTRGCAPSTLASMGNGEAASTARARLRTSSLESGGSGFMI